MGIDGNDELLDVLPETHSSRTAVLQQLQAQVKGLTALQSGSGFWHQLLDREDSYLETSATAIYAYCIAHACNKGWLDPPAAYASMAMLAWDRSKHQNETIKDRWKEPAWEPEWRLIRHFIIIVL